MPPPPGMLPPPGIVAGSPFPPASQQQPGAPFSTPPAAQQPQAPATPQIERVKSSAVQLKPGTLLVFGDNDTSPEEKRAALAQYRVATEAAGELKGETGVAEASASASDTAAGGRKRPRAEDLI